MSKRNFCFETEGVTLFKSITMFCVSDNIPQNMWEIHIECGKYHSIPHTNVMELNNVMHVSNTSSH
jgi:hypothetical protein